MVPSLLGQVHSLSSPPLINIILSLLMNEFKIKNKKDILINIIEPEYKSTNKNTVKGIVIHLHGICSHFQKFMEYPELLDSLHAKNKYFSGIDLKSYAIEFHGHGKSEGTRCNINNFDDLLDDVDSLIEYLKENIDNFDEKKLFIMAESMGGAVAIKYAITRKQKIDGLILLSPMCGIDDSLKPSWIKTKFLMALSFLLPEKQLIDTAADIPGRCKVKPLYAKIREKDTYYYTDNHRLCTARECLNASEWLSQNGNQMNTPFILFHGLKDTITVPKKSIEFYENAKIDVIHKELILLDDSDHGVLNEKYENDTTPIKVFDDIIKWTKKMLN